MSNGFKFNTFNNDQTAQTTPQIIQGPSLIQRATASIRGAIGDKISPIGSFLTKQYQGFQKEQKGFSTAAILRANIPSEEKERLIKQQQEPMTGERFLQTQLDVALPEIKALGIAAPLIAKGIKETGIISKIAQKAKTIFKYDFGGAEGPLKGDWTVIDNVLEKQFKKWFPKNTNKYIQQDISKPFQLPPAKEINIGSTLRQLGNLAEEGGLLYMPGEKFELPIKELKQVVQNIDNNLLPGGKVTIYDHKELIDPVVKDLKELNYTELSKKKIYSRDEDFPAEWEFILKKSKQTFDQVLKSSKQVFGGFTDLSTKVLNKLVGRSEASKQFILDTMKYTAKKKGLSKAESNLLLETLKEFPNQGKIAIKEFADNVKTKLLPLKKQSMGFRKGDVNESIPYESLSEVQKEFRYKSTSLPKDLKGKVDNYFERVWESPIETSGGSIHFEKVDAPNYFAHTRIEDIPGDTRRILETQSDLFQKGRLATETTEMGPLGNMRNVNPERLEELKKLEPYENDWYKRIVQEEVREAAKDGKKALQFPRGETAMKIEGLAVEEGEKFIWFDSKGFEKINKLEISPTTDINIIPTDLKVGKVILNNRYIDGRGQHAKWIITDVLENGKFKAAPLEKLHNWYSEEIYRTYLLETKNVDDFSKFLKAKTSRTGITLGEQISGMGFTETFDISGKVDTQNFVYKLNEDLIPKYLKKIYPDIQKITDPQGVKWWEIKIKPEYKKLPVEAFSIMPLIMLGEGEE